MIILALFLPTLLWLLVRLWWSPLPEWARRTLWVIVVAGLAIPSAVRLGFTPNNTYYAALAGLAWGELLWHWGQRTFFNKPPKQP